MVRLSENQTPILPSYIILRVRGRVFLFLHNSQHKQYKHFMHTTIHMNSTQHKVQNNMYKIHSVQSQFVKTFSSFKNLKFLVE